MAGKDIDLVIKAKDKASSELEKISKALKKNVEDQKDLAKGAGATSVALGKLSGDAAKFQNELNKLKSAGKIAAELDKAAASVTRMEGSVRTSGAELAKMARESDAAAQAANRLKGQLAAEEAALTSNKTALAAARKELSERNKLLQDAEKAQIRYNQASGAQRSTPGVGKTNGAPQTNAKASAGVFIAADIAAAKAAVAQATSGVNQYESAVKGSSSAIKVMRAEVSAATSLQRQLGTDTERAAAALTSERESLNTARVELGAIKQVSAQAGEALGTVAISQEQVSQAAARMAANLAAAKARIEGLAGVKTTGTAAASLGAGSNADAEAQAKALTAQRRAMLEARKEYAGAQNEVKALAQEMRAATAPTEALGAAFGAAQARARLAKQEYEAQRTALVGLSSSAKTGFAEFSNIAREIEKPGAAAAAAARTAAGAQSQLIASMRQTGAVSADAATKTTLFGNALTNIGNGSRQSLSLLQRLRGEVLSLTASYIGFQAAIGQVGGAVNAFRQLQATQNRLGAVFNQDTAKVGAEIQFLQQQAERLGISFATLADEYGKFTVAAKTSNFTTAETRKIFLSVAEAARVNSLSTEQMSGVFLALTQMISKGKVSSEELRRQLGDRLTGAFSIFASAIGVTTAELDKMMQKGEVLADRSTLLKFADELSNRFGAQLPTVLKGIEADLGRFETGIFNAQIAIGKGLVPALQDAIRSFNEFAKSDAGKDTFATFGAVVGNLLKVLAEVPKYFNLIVISAKAFVAVQIGSAFSGLIARAVQTTSSIAAFSRELKLSGSVAQQASASQGMFTRGLAQTVGALGQYRAGLLASTSQSSLARAGVVSMAGAVGLLEKGLIATASVARGFLAAFGGPVGIAIAAITFAVSSWVTSVDQASAALTVHQQHLEQIKTGYLEAEGNATKLRDRLKEISAYELAKSIRDTKTAFDGVLSSAKGISTTLKAGFSDLLPDDKRVKQAEQIAKALEHVQEATNPQSVKELRDVLSDIGQSPADETIGLIVDELFKLVNSSEDGTKGLGDLAKSVAESEAALRLYQGTASDADKALLGLGKAVDAVEASVDNGSALTAYGEAVDTLKSKIPALADELKKLKDITEINKSAWEGLVAAFQMGDFSKVAEVIRLWGQATAGTEQAFQQKQFDSLPDSSKKLVDRIIYVEGGQTKASDTNKSGSSAQGIGQFTERTFLPIFNQLFPALKDLTDAQKLEYRYNISYARPILEEFTKQNQIRLANSGVAPTDANTYLAHFLGAGDAIKVALANPDELARKLVDPKSVAANPTVFGPRTTAGDLQDWARSKVGGGSEIMAGGQTKQEAFDQNLDQQNKARREEADARKESNREGVIAKALAEAEGQALKDNVVLTQQQRDAIRESVGAKYDSAHADEQLKKNQSDAREQLNDIVGLDQQRKVLLEEIAMAQNAGDNGKTAELGVQLQGVNAQLAAAIPKALELARALGDEKMVAQLQKVQLNTAKVGSQFSFLGLSFNQTKQLATGFADGLVNAFDSFAQSVANGENAMQALGKAFLQFAADFLRQIATMILKQLIFNALNSVFPGLGLGVGTGHTGGLVGSSTIGGGNMSRQVSPAWFANATRYHSGGIAGLRPDEVPAVLKKNEEVLTEQDPRHRFNQGSQGQGSGGAQGQPIKQVLVLDPSELANAMSSSHGEKVVMTILKNNKANVRSIIGG